MADESHFTAVAGADLTGKRYHIMRLSAARTCNQASLATDSGNLGVLQTEGASGEAVTIKDRGRSMVTAGAALTAGDHFSSNGSGRAITVVSGAVALGRVVEAAAADGDLVEARLYPPVRWAGAP